MFAVTPLLALPVLLYNLFALGLKGGLSATEAPVRLAWPLFTLKAGGGALWPVSAADLMLAFALVVLFVELVKASASRRLSVVNHSLGIVLFIACLVELLIVPACATSTFFLLTLMVLLDVIAGLIATLADARREPEVRGRS